MSVKLVRAEKSQIPALSKIMFDAFKGIGDAHNFPSDVPTPEICDFAMTSFVTRPDMYGVVAVDDAGRVIGHNFLQLSDEVAGVGPICVEPGVQAKGVGRMLIQAVARRDYPVVQGVVMIVAGLYVLINLMVDLLYGYLDPRLRVKSG